MSFALILTLLSAVTGVIYLLDILIWEKKRSPNEKPSKIIEQARSFFPVFISVLLIRSFVVEPFRIPSGSLEPTLDIGDFIMVNKFAYGLKLPVSETQIIPVGQPKHGDIAIFRWPPNPQFDYIKRVIGQPGDLITYHNKVLSINGKEATQTFVRNTIDPSSQANVAEYIEDLDGVKHAIFINPDVPAFDFSVRVPKDHYFMMGDNRDNSADSRYFGFVHKEFLRGKAMLIWMSWDGKQYRIRWSRVGHPIH